MEYMGDKVDMAPSQELARKVKRSLGNDGLGVRPIVWQSEDVIDGSMTTKAAFSETTRALTGGSKDAKMNGPGLAGGPERRRSRYQHFCIFPQFCREKLSAGTYS